MKNTSFNSVELRLIEEFGKKEDGTEFEYMAYNRFRNEQRLEAANVLQKINDTHQKINYACSNADYECKVKTTMTVLGALIVFLIACYITSWF